MDTPESKSTPAKTTKFKLISTSSSDSPAVQDSPVFNFLSNLSPIQQAKPGPVAQGFPGLASPPLVFTSPRINSQTSFINRKLQSAGSNSEFSQDNCHKNERDLGDSVKLDLEFRSPLVPSDQTACNNEKLVVAAHCSPSVCFDEFLADPGQCANSLNKIQSEDAHPYVGGCLQKIDAGNAKDVGLDSSALQKGKQTVPAKSRISVKVVKNKPRSSECSGALSRLSDHKSDICQFEDSTNEASHFERGTLRRCLFDESQKKYSSDGSGFENTSASSQIQDSSNMFTGKSESRQTIDLLKPAIGGCVSQATGTGSNPAVISKPLGIGLHLNSVVYPRSTDSSTGSQQPSKVRVEGKKSLFIRRNQSDKNLSATNVVTKVPPSSEEIDVVDQHQERVLPTADNTIASDSIVQYNNTIESKLDASSRIKCEKRKLSSDLPENNESSLVSPKKKRKKPANSTDDDTTKRCNCRKTKCLKLYCDCFAAGFYCGESCACQGCFNRPEYEATVLETRQQIESRNPLAFAPKVLQPVADSPASIKEIGDLSTPSSARHKRGCNCKKSMCLKKYCECYQANVGCSEGCRCEGCKNIYGIREDFSVAREVLIKRASVELLEGTMTVNNSYARSRVHNSPNLVPVTPALQCSDQKKNALKSRLPLRSFLQSSGSRQDTLTDEENLTSPKTSQNHSLPLEESKCIDGGALDDADKGFENTEDRFVLADEPYPQSSNTDTINSNLKNISQPESFDDSDLSHAHCSQTSNTSTDNCNLKNISQPKSFDESGPSLPSSSSLRWRSSPITPITHLATSELQDFGTVSKHSDLFEDDTPEILKPSSTPAESVKVSSPNKKRVSPPHNHKNSSESLKSSRKFVLRAVPTFPSLTPYSKNNNQQQ